MPDATPQRWLCSAARRGESWHLRRGTRQRAISAPGDDQQRLPVVSCRPQTAPPSAARPAPDHQRPASHERPHRPRRRPPDRGDQVFRPKGLPQASGRARAVEGRVHEL
ncbi:MAG: hypothetical protein DWH79_09015, partial [Planctomycetota bacterium]